MLSLRRSSTSRPACELLDRRLLSVVRDVERGIAIGYPTPPRRSSSSSTEGNSADNVVERVLLNQNRLDRVKRLTLQTREVYGEPYMSLCWKVRDRAMPRMTRVADNVLPTPFVENTRRPADTTPGLSGPGAEHHEEIGRYRDPTPRTRGSASSMLAHFSIFIERTIA